MSDPEILGYLCMSTDDRRRPTTADPWYCCIVAVESTTARGDTRTYTTVYLTREVRQLFSATTSAASSATPLSRLAFDPTTTQSLTRAVREQTSLAVRAGFVGTRDNGTYADSESEDDDGVTEEVPTQFRDRGSPKTNPRLQGIVDDFLTSAPPNVSFPNGFNSSAPGDWIQRRDVSINSEVSLEVARSVRAGTTPPNDVSRRLELVRRSQQDEARTSLVQPERYVQDLDDMRRFEEGARRKKRGYPTPTTNTDDNSSVSSLPQDEPVRQPKRVGRAVNLLKIRKSGGYCTSRPAAASSIPLPFPSTSQQQLFAASKRDSGVTFQRRMVLVAGPIGNYEHSKRFGLIVGSKRGLANRCSEATELARRQNIPVGMDLTALVSPTSMRVVELCSAAGNVWSMPENSMAKFQAIVHGQ